MNLLSHKAPRREQAKNKFDLGGISLARNVRIVRYHLRERHTVNMANMCSNSFPSVVELSRCTCVGLCVLSSDREMHGMPSSNITANTPLMVNVVPNLTTQFGFNF